MTEHFIDERQFSQLKLFANLMRAYYFGHVYLIGSSLKRSDFLDVDVTVVIPNEYWEARYGKVEYFLDENIGKRPPSVLRKWERDCEKKWIKGCQITGLNLDFKVLPESLFQFKDPFIKLDDE